MYIIQTRNKLKVVLKLHNDLVDSATLYKEGKIRRCLFG